MSYGKKLAACVIAPYIAWMALMAALPSTAVCYAVRTGVTLAVGIAAVAVWRRTVSGLADSSAPSFRLSFADLAVGLAAGVLVWALWVFPERFEIYRRLFIIGGGDASVDAAQSPYDPAVCGWPLTAVRFAGSAFVIAAAEEIFFRSFLYRWIAGRNRLSPDAAKFDMSAFLWTTALFALEHDRWLAGAAAGAAYACIAIRRGISAAVVAHMTTNFILGLQVVATGAWGFW